MEDLFNLDSNSTLGVFDEKKKNNDGLFRPDPKDGEPDKGYVAKLRFLPNFSKKQVVGESAIEKMTHYINIDGHEDLKGALDCQKNFNEPCPICNLYWKLQNSKNVIDNNKARMINRSVSYYSYIMIVEDEQHPELEGKIMILQYGVKIAGKIKEEKMGMYGSKTNVFDLAEGKDFLLVVKKRGEWNNYDSSKFLETKPLTIKGKDGTFKVLPTEESNGRKFIAAKARDKVKDFLLKRDYDIEKFAPKPWTEEDHTRAKRIVEVLSGVNNEFEAASRQISNSEQSVNPNATSTNTAVPAVETALSDANASDKEIDDFFDDI